MSIPFEAPPESLPVDAREYLLRVIQLLDTAINSSDKLPKRTDIDVQPLVGKLYFFSNAIPNPTGTETVVDSEGYYGFLTTGWVKLG